MKNYFGNNDKTSQEFNEAQFKSIESLITKFLDNTEEQKTNFIRLIDLLYKKYIIKPTKDTLSLKKDQHKVFNIFESGLIRG